MPTAAGLYYAQFDEGHKDEPPVILIHGAGSNHLVWPAEIRRLSGQRHTEERHSRIRWRCIAGAELDHYSHGDRPLGQGCPARQREPSRSRRAAQLPWSWPSAIHRMLRGWD